MLSIFYGVALLLGMYGGRRKKIQKSEGGSILLHVMEEILERCNNEDLNSMR